MAVNIIIDIKAHTSLSDPASPPISTAKLVRCMLEHWIKLSVCCAVVTPSVDHPPLKITM